MDNKFEAVGLPLPNDAPEQGCIVTYQRPSARSPELTWKQTGVILSSNRFNRLSGRTHILICPIIIPGSHHAVFNSHFGIALPPGTPEEAKIEGGYLRPDFIQSIVPRLGKVEFITRDGRPLKVPSELIQQSVGRLMDIIRPTQQKLYDNGAPNNCPNYGEVVLFDSVPRYTELDIDTTPVLCLTLSSMWKRTNNAIVIRGDRNLERPKSRTEVDLELARDLVFLNPLSPFTLAPAIRLTKEKHLQQRRVRLPQATLEEVVQKLHGCLDPEVEANSRSDLFERSGPRLRHQGSSFPRSAHTR